MLYKKTLLVVLVVFIVGEMLVLFSPALKYSVTRLFYTPPVIEIAYAINPSDSFAHHIGNQYLRWGTGNRTPGIYNREYAKKFYKKALNLNPDDAEARYKIGLINFIDGNFGAASVELTQLIREFPPEHDLSKRARYIRALTYAYAGVFDEAAAGFEELLEIDGDNAHWAVSVDLAWVYFQQGEYENMHTVMENVAALHPKNPWVLANFGLALLNIGEPAKAVQVYGEAERLVQEVTPGEWIAVYPGNDPAGAERGLEKLHLVIVENKAEAAKRVDNL